MKIESDKELAERHIVYIATVFLIVLQVGVLGIQNLQQLLSY